MTPNHHPADELLRRYAAGGLSAGSQLTVASHLGFCADCREDVAQLEAGIIAQIKALPKSPLKPGALDLALARIDRAKAEPAEQLGDAGLALPDQLGFRASRSRWLGHGLHAVVLKGRTERVYILHAAKGARIPRHHHKGYEHTCVLKGSFQDGERFAKGDFIACDEAFEHGPVADPAEGCVCIIATSGSLRWRGLLPRLMQAALGF